MGVRLRIRLIRKNIFPMKKLLIFLVKSVVDIENYYEIKLFTEVKLFILSLIRFKTGQYINTW